MLWGPKYTSVLTRTEKGISFFINFSAAGYNILIKLTLFFESNIRAYFVQLKKNTTLANPFPFFFQSIKSWRFVCYLRRIF